MNSFSELISRAIFDYKKILKKKVPQGHYSNVLSQLGIKRLQLKNLNEASLLQIAHKILKDLEQSCEYSHKGQIIYSGIQEFKNHLKNIVTSYCVTENKVVNPSQKASAIILEAIQLISLPNSKITANTVKKLESCIENLIQYGTVQQLTMMVNALKKQGSEKMDFCSMLLNKLENHLHSVQEQEGLLEE